MILSVRSDISRSYAWQRANMSTAQACKRLAEAVRRGDVTESQKIAAQLAKSKAHILVTEAKEQYYDMEPGVGHHHHYMHMDINPEGVAGGHMELDMSQETDTDGTHTGHASPQYSKHEFLQVLQSMGFTKSKENEQAWLISEGRMDVAVEWLDQDPAERKQVAGTGAVSPHGPADPDEASKELIEALRRQDSIERKDRMHEEEQSSQLIQELQRKEQEEKERRKKYNQEMLAQSEAVLAKLKQTPEKGVEPNLAEFDCLICFDTIGFGVGGTTVVWPSAVHGLYAALLCSAADVGVAVALTSFGRQLCMCMDCDVCLSWCCATGFGVVVALRVWCWCGTAVVWTSAVHGLYAVLCSAAEVGVVVALRGWCCCGTPVVWTSAVHGLNAVLCSAAEVGVVVALRGWCCCGTPVVWTSAVHGLYAVLCSAAEVGVVVALRGWCCCGTPVVWSSAMHGLYAVLCSAAEVGVGVALRGWCWGGTPVVWSSAMHGLYAVLCYAAEVGVEVGVGVALRSCGHQLCMDCISQNVEFAINNAEYPVSCPDQKCRKPLAQADIRAIVGEEKFLKLEERMMGNFEAENRDAFHCLSKDCRGWCVFEEDALDFRCPICKCFNCIPCKAQHPKKNCKQYQEDLKLAAQNDKDAQATQAGIEAMIAKREMMRCPGCQILVSKLSGCDWMKCRMCKTEICWATMGPRWGKGGNGDKSGGCGCQYPAKKCHPNCGNCH
eukprot:g27551.t1